MLGRTATGSLGLSLGWSLLTATAFAQGAPQGPPAVGVIQVAPQPVTESTEFIGRVEATDRVDIVARVTGFMQEQLFREGQEVKRGDILYRLEKPPFEAQVAQSQANVASAEAELANARVSLGRAQELARSNFGTRANLDTATAQERTSTASLLGSQAALRVSQINLGYTDIAAPIDGRIGRTNITVGNVVSPTAGTLATIVSQDPMRVAFPISARQAEELRQRYAGRGGLDATRVRLRLSDGSLYDQSGKIVFLDNQIDRNTDTLLVRALIPNPRRGNAGDTVGGRQLIDGQFANVLVEGIQPVQAIVIPRAAVLQDQQGSYVFVLGSDRKAARRDVTLGRPLGENVVVEKGLENGQTVVTEGIQRVRPGQEVNPAPASTPAAAQAGANRPENAAGGTAAPANPTPGTTPGPAQGPVPAGQAPASPALPNAPATSQQGQGGRG
ncbi:efflux RND transporter periplasmic adaptor subunit [Roseomonas elaeocarpi]|uniref:Efflux RND transporter periplasmic adaptor subunit n=1 Tax=Roseomonas elaeocarpi TaxID=907779 RepID=A0ABV6JQQ8_9PROT